MYSAIGSYTRDKLEEVASSYVEEFLKEVNKSSPSKEHMEIISALEDAWKAKEIDFALSIMENLSLQTNQKLVIRIVKTQMLLDS
jgi:hypothetical protein